MSTNSNCKNASTVVIQIFLLNFACLCGINLVYKDGFFLTAISWTRKCISPSSALSMPQERLHSNSIFSVTKWSWQRNAVIMKHTNANCLKDSTNNLYLKSGASKDVTRQKGTPRWQIFSFVSFFLNVIVSCCLGLCQSQRKGGNLFVVNFM